MTAVPEPSDALYRAVLYAIHRATCTEECTTRLFTDEEQRTARAAYAAMVEHLGLVEETRRASPQEVKAWKLRRGYDTNHETGWGIPPRRVL